MFKYIFILVLFVSGEKSLAQNYEYVYKNRADSTFNCYLKVIPDDTIKGLVIRDFSRLPNINKKSPYKFTQLAVDEGLIVLYTVTSNQFPELYYTDVGPQMLDSMVAEVIEAHQIPKENIFIGGISASGARALRYTQYCAQGKSTFGTEIKGAFAVDSPLDIVRFYKSAYDHINILKNGMEEEAEMVLRKFVEFLGGTPNEVLEAYQKASVYSSNAKNGGNAVHLKNTNLLFFHEPDMDWWGPERGATYFDINSYDINGIVTCLRALGNNKVTEIITSGKGFLRNGERNCHSWSIVDEEYLSNWILNLLSE
jgi:hypothetical protein